MTLCAILEVEHVGYDEDIEERRKGRRGATSNEPDAGVWIADVPKSFVCKGSGIGSVRACPNKVGGGG